jgi:hypothetical protein
MSKHVPCPNPACSAVFSAEAVRARSKPTCPRCGTRLSSDAAPSSVRRRQDSANRSASERVVKAGDVPPSGSLRSAVELAGGGPPEVDPAPQARERPLVPPKSRAKEVVPPAPPTPAESITAAADPAPDAPAAIIKLRGARRRQRLGRMLATLVVVVTAIGAGAWGCWWLYSTNTTSSERGDGEGRTDASHVLPALGPGWRKDPDLQLRMHVATAARHSQPAAAMAFVSRDYKTRLPGDGELIDETLAKLHSQFKRVEWENAPGATLLGGRKALAINFDATDADEVDVLGTAYLLAFRGVGYWLILWAPAGDKDQAAPELERIRASFALSPTFREGWQESQPKPELLRVREADVSLAYSKTVWEEEDKTGFDPKAVRVLKGSFPADGAGHQRDRHAGKVAIVQVLVLDSGASAGDKARAYLLEAQKDPDRGNYPGTTLTTVKNKSGEEEDNDADFGPLHGRLTKLRMANTEDRQRFVVLGMVPRPERRLVVVWCECDWALRDYWDQEFGTLLNSLRPSKSKAAKPAEEKNVPVKDE